MFPRLLDSNLNFSSTGSRVSNTAAAADIIIVIIIIIIRNTGSRNSSRSYSFSNVTINLYIIIDKAKAK